MVFIEIRFSFFFSDAEKDALKRYNTDTLKSGLRMYTQFELVLLLNAFQEHAQLVRFYNTKRVVSECLISQTWPRNAWKQHAFKLLANVFGSAKSTPVSSNLGWFYISSVPFE